MALNIERVHVMERDATGRDILVKSSPYTRFVSSEGGAMAVQGGRFYSDGDGQPVIPFNEVPSWVWKAVRGMTPEGRENVGLPANMDELEELPAPAPVEDTGQKSTVKEEPSKTLVDYVYELDASVDAHWTKTGLPDLNAIKELVGRYVTRGEVEAACPGYRQPKES
tara:strand:+ start:2165 stop:2665 length:501 start_codon:yes stop_codon:yes gene_type:complete